MHARLGFLKTTAIGGLIFLLPLIVLGALVGQAVQIVWLVAEALGQWIPVRSPRGIALLLVAAVAVLVLMCFAAGVVARWSLGQRLSAGFEKKLMMLFPRYAIFKDQLAGTIGGDVARPELKPVLARFADCCRVGLEVKRGPAGWVVIYLPGAPDPWSGTVVLLAAERVEPLTSDFGETVACFEKLGRDLGELLAESLGDPQALQGDSQASERFTPRRRERPE